MLPWSVLHVAVFLTIHMQFGVSYDSWEADPSLLPQGGAPDAGEANQHLFSSPSTLPTVTGSKEGMCLSWFHKVISSLWF